MKRRALNRACVMRWKKVRVGSLRPRVAIITPSWLRVERAMIFLRSDSVVAARPAISIVRDAIKRRDGWKSGCVDRNG